MTVQANEKDSEDSLDVEWGPLWPMEFRLVGHGSRRGPELGSVVRSNLDRKSAIGGHRGIFACDPVVIQVRPTGGASSAGDQ